MGTTPAGRLRLEERLDKPAHSHHNDERQNYKGNSDNSNEYRSDTFHPAPYRDYLHLLVESNPLSGSHQGLRPLPAGLKSCSYEVCKRRTSPEAARWDKQCSPVGACDGWYRVGSGASHHRGLGITSPKDSLGE